MQTGAPVPCNAPAGSSMSGPITDAAIQINGSSTSVVENNDIDGVWGDFTGVTGLHEAAFPGNDPATDITVTGNNNNGANRNGVSIVWAQRVNITNNIFRNVNINNIDIESDNVGGPEQDISEI